MSTSKVKNIFLAEDDEDDVVIFNEIISDITDSIVVTIAPNGTELMKLLQDESLQPELIFLDLNMPLKNGFECLQEIKRNAAWKNITVIMYSTFAQLQQVEKAYKQGADLYMQKSTSYSDFKLAVEKCIATYDAFNN